MAERSGSEWNCGGCAGGNCPGCAGGSSTANCGGCPGGTGGCPGGGTLYLTEGEIGLLRRFGEIPFWPVCRTAGGEEPICLEEGMEPDLLSALSLKGLIQIDYDLPLSNFDYTPYAACPHHGSMALTAAGQRAVELLEVQGVEE